MKRLLLFFIPALLLLISCIPRYNHRLFVGGFTKSGENGLTIYDFNGRTGELTHLAKFNAGPNPAYFCYSPERKLLYVANEVMNFNGQSGGGLTTYSYDAENISIEKEHEMLIPYGGPCYISLSPDSGYLFLANYPRGSVVVVSLDDNGIPERISDTILYHRPEPGASHAHMIMNDRDGEKIYVTDLGLNRIIRYDFDTSKGILIDEDTIHVQEGYGPRHFDFSSDGSMLYVINELGSKLTVFSLKNGRPELVQTLPTTREGFDRDNFCADIHLGKDGRYLYGSNRGENSIVVFSVKADGTLELAGHTTCGGNWPRNFTLDPSGGYLLVGNQKSDSLAVFRLDRKTGMPVEPPVKYQVTAPACLKFYPLPNPGGKEQASRNAGRERG
jgi:6-phosphogluconolactonase